MEIDGVDVHFTLLPPPTPPLAQPVIVFLLSVFLKSWSNTEQTEVETDADVAKGWIPKVHVQLSLASLPILIYFLFCAEAQNHNRIWLVFYLQLFCKVPLGMNYS